MNNSYLILRYNNRKLYDTQTHKYTTLKGLVSLIKEDKNIVVINNADKRDITSLTLCQVVLANGVKVTKQSLIDVIKLG